MTETETRTASRRETWGWGILVAIGVLLTANGAILYLFVADTELFRTMGLLHAGFGILATVIALDGYLHRTRWAWNASWAIVAVLAVIAVHAVVGSEPDVAITYVIYAVAALAAQLLTRPT